MATRPMRTHAFSRAHQVQTAYTFRHLNAGSNLSDPFTVDPIRRSAITVSICSAILAVPVFLRHDLAVTVMLTVGWLAGVALVFVVPILIWSVVAEGLAIIRRRLHPPIDDLDLPPRLLHILHRGKFDTIVGVDRADDATLMLLANIDMRDVEQIRRAISLWKYARWQAAGFPASEIP